MKTTILLIEDDRDQRDLLTAILEEFSYEVHAEGSGRAGLEALKKDTYDLVITDMQMPEMSGEEVLEIVRVTFPDMPVIILTAYGSVKSAVSAMSKGAFEYVLKPVEDEELRLTVERALEHRDLNREVRFLRGQVGRYGKMMVAESPAMEKAVKMMKRVAMADSTVLITGETGSGKEVAAKFIHMNSARASKPFVAFNCAALNANILESELFGHEKGAFTGAASRREGRFEEADGGTILLDEIGEVPLEFQAKLLRVLQERTFERMGSSKSIEVDVRILASTNRNLEQEVKEGRFREDLLYRLKVVPVELPALRERVEDIEPLVNHFLRMYANQYNAPLKGFEAAALRFLENHEWPGNIRELQHAVERAVVLSDGEQLVLHDFSFLDGAETQAPQPISTEELEQGLTEFLDARAADFIIRVLNEVGWHKQKAADMLQVDRATLYRLIKKHRIRQ